MRRSASSKYKKPLIVSIFVIALPIQPYTEDKTNPAPENSAKLVIYRQRHSPSINFKPHILIDGKEAFYLVRGHYAELELSPGQNEIVAIGR